METKAPETPSPFVAYYRVSTQRQGRSGLGIEAQRAAVARFAEAEASATLRLTLVARGQAARSLLILARGVAAVARGG